MNKLHFSKSEAISFGWKKTKEHLGFFILLLVVVFGVSLFAAFLEEFLLTGVGVFGSMTGALAFFVGLLVAIPVASMAWVFVYRKLLSQMEESVAEVL